MKIIVSIYCCFLFSIVSFGQTNTVLKLEREKADFYTISKNELTTYFKHKKEHFSVNEHFQLYRRKVVTKTVQTKISNFPKQLKNVSNIVKYDFKSLVNNKFIAYKDDVKYELFQLNTELFILKEFRKDIDTENREIWRQYGIQFIPFTYVDFKKGKKIIKFLGYTSGHIIPKKDTIETTVWIYHNRKKLIPIQFTDIQAFDRKFTSKELSEMIYGRNRLQRYYEIVTKKNKKRLYNYRGENVLQKSYDSIVLSSFIIGYKGKKNDVYNQTFQKLALPKLQAVYLDRSNLYNLQIIQNNELKSIPLSGDTSEKYMLSNPTPPYMPTLTSELEYRIEERENEFAILREFTFDTVTIPKKGIKDIFFLKNKQQKITTEHAPFIITKHTNNQYSMVDVYHPTKKLLETVDRIELIHNSIRFKENNKYGYYGIHKKARFQKLEAFQGFFAKFELPNGQKGWLDRNGKEYPNL
ncbi:hypothetical protein [Kordia sp.]|uniref:hypothetical protein n=1 Tax=Kordia sp. TaxID=1965332 RepID=UPI003D6B7BFA